MDAIKTKGILVTFYRDAIGGDYLESLNTAIKELEKLSSEAKLVLSPITPNGQSLNTEEITIV